jgi:hypothetical protein
LSFRRQLLVSMGLQGVGAASVLLAVLWLGVRCGPEVQGSFSRAKSELEFLAALATFGLPQALFYFVRSGGLSLRAALGWGGCSAALALLLGAVYGVIMRFDAWALLGLAVAVCVLQGQLRSLVLACAHSAWFNAVTALPQVLTLMGVGMVMSFFLPLTAPSLAWFSVFSLAYGAAVVLAWWPLQGSTNLAAITNPVGWRPMANYGLAAWLTAVMCAAGVVVMQRWVHAKLGPAALGQFTLAMTLVQVPLLPITYAAPLLLRRWMTQSGVHDSRRWSWRLFVGLAAFAGLVALGARWCNDLGLGAAYQGTTLALAWLLLGGAAEAASRVLTVQASAVGWPWLAVRAEAARWGVLALAWAVVKPDGLLVLCAAWSAAALAAASVYWWCGQKAAP